MRPTRAVKYTLITNLGTTLLLSAQLALANNELPELTEADFLDELPVVLSATRLQQSVHDAPASITIIDRDMIRASGVREIADIFRLAPGFQVGWPEGTNPVVTYHGMSDQFQRRMQILIDGRSAYQPSWGGAGWSSLPLVIDDIERIEVIRGPNAAAHGSNAFKATINIITQHSTKAKGELIRAGHGTNNVEQIVLRHGGTADNLSYRLTFGHDQDNGVSDPDLTVIGGNSGVDRWDYKYVPRLTFRADQQLDLRNQLQYQAGYTKSEFGDRRSGVYFPTYTVRYFGQIRWEHNASSENQISLQFYHDHTHTDDYFESSRLARNFGIDSQASYVPVDRSESADRYDIELQHTVSLTKDLRIVWGMNSRQDSVESQFFYNRDGDFLVNQHRIFSNLEFFATPWLLLNVGIMEEYNTTSGRNTSPRAAVNFRLSDSQTARMSVTRGYRAPFAYEQHADTRYIYNGPVTALQGTLLDIDVLATEELKPEEITSYEIGYVFQKPSSPFSMDLKLFREELRNIISPYPLIFGLHPIVAALGDPYPKLNPPSSFPYFITFGNLDSVDIQGLEAQFEYAPTRESRIRFSYAYLDPDGTDNSTLPGLYEDYIYDISMPKHSASLMAFYLPSDNIQLSAAYYWVDSMRWNGGLPTDNFVTPQYKRLDLRVGMPFRTPTYEGDFALVFQNLLEDYEDYRPSGVIGTQGYVSLRLQFY